MLLLFSRKPRRVWKFGFQFLRDILITVRATETSCLRELFQGAESDRDRPPCAILRYRSNEAGSVEP